MSTISVCLKNAVWNTFNSESAGRVPYINVSVVAKQQGLNGLF